MALLAATGSLNLWEVGALVALYGAGTAFFSPAFDAVVPDVLPPGLLAQANALDQFVRPIAFRLAGPASAASSSAPWARARPSRWTRCRSWPRAWPSPRCARSAGWARDAGVSMTAEIREGFSFEQYVI